MTMPTKGQNGSQWRRLLFYRRESLRTTWKLRFTVLLVAGLLAWSTRALWTVRVGESLVCMEETFPADILLLENFDPTYLVFEHARSLEDAGVASRMVVPVRESRDPGEVNPVSAGIAGVMAGVARVRNMELLPIREVEPISLNAAEQIREFLIAEGIGSVVVVTPAFRSRRSMLIYDAVLGPAGIIVGCAPVQEDRTTVNWFDTWHGIQEVGLQFLKLQYYRFYVLL